MEDGKNHGKVKEIEPCLDFTEFDMLKISSKFSMSEFRSPSCFVSFLGTEPINLFEFFMYLERVLN